MKKDLSNTTFAVDIDGTLTIETKGWTNKDYRNRTPVYHAIEMVNMLYSNGATIILYTARYEEDRALTLDWLRQYGVKFHKLVFDKVKYDWLIDDKAVTNFDELAFKTNGKFRTYQFGHNCWRFTHGNIKKDEYHPCFFCSEPIPLRDANFIECKDCFIMKCPKCGNCLCTISAVEYLSAIKCHHKYCKHLDDWWNGKVGEFGSHKIEQNFQKALDICYANEENIQKDET